MSINSIILILIIQGVGENLPISSSTFLSYFNLSKNMENSAAFHFGSGLAGFFFYLPNLFKFSKDQFRFFFLFGLTFVIAGLCFLIFKIDQYTINSYIFNLIFTISLIIRLLFFDKGKSKLSWYSGIFLGIVPFITMILKTSRLGGLFEILFSFLSLHTAYDYSMICTSIVNLSAIYYYKDILSSLNIVIGVAFIGFISLYIIRKFLFSIFFISLILRLVFLLYLFFKL